MMLGVSFVFLGMSVVAAAIGFAGFSSTTAIFQDLFYVFIALFILSFLFHAARRDETEIKSNAKLK